MIAATPAEAWPLWTEEELRDEWVRSHLIRSLTHWQAFRNFNKQLVENPRAALRQNLASFLLDIQAIPEARLRLGDVSDSDIQTPAVAVTSRLRRFGRDVKGRDSCVLPSKTAHFVLLPLIPAYDLHMIRDRTLCKLAPTAWDMESYMMMCWWILQQYKREGTLQQARDHVAAYMRAQPMAWTRRLPRPEAGHWLLHSMD